MAMERARSFRLGRSAAIVIGLSVACTAGSLVFIQSQHDGPGQRTMDWQHGWSSLAPEVGEAFDAVRDGRADDLEKILEKHPTLVNADGSGMSLMDLAAVRGDTDIVEVLLKYHADVDAPNRAGTTPLDYAAFAGSRPMVHWLLAHDANANARSRRELTPIFYAARGSGRFDDPKADYIGVCELLFNAGASPNLPDVEGFMAIENASEPVARFLLDHGAKLTPPDHNNPRPWDHRQGE